MAAPTSSCCLDHSDADDKQIFAKFKTFSRHEAMTSVAEELTLGRSPLNGLQTQKDAKP